VGVTKPTMKRLVLLLGLATMPLYGQYYRAPTPVPTVRPTPRPTATIPIYQTPVPTNPPYVTPTPFPSTTPSYVAREWRITIEIKENGVMVQKDVYVFNGEDCFLQWASPCIANLKRN